MSAPALDDAMRVAVGAEASRRAAWREYYRIKRELDEVRQQLGEIFDGNGIVEIEFTCPCCGLAAGAYGGKSRQWRNVIDARGSQGREDSWHDHEMGVTS